MRNKFLENINSHNLFSKKDIIIVAISGGGDSVALSLLLKELDFNFILAHCNFNLRGKESDDDEQFVRILAQRLEVQLEVKQFNVIEYSSERKMSIQMAARELRYKWFEELRKDLNANFIAIAHHKDDDIETFFINLIRGSGIRGFLGMKQKRDKIIRPLLPFNSLEIKKYLQFIKQDFRTDSSNQDTKYLRNNIRKNIIPNIFKINPSFSSTFSNETEYLNSVFSVFKSKIHELIKKVVTLRGKDVFIDKQKLLNIHERKILIHEIVSEYGFKESKKILDNCSLTSGKIFYSTTHRLLVDRDYLIISKIDHTNNLLVDIKKTDLEILDPIIMKLNFSNDLKFINRKNIAFFDAEKLHFPLQIRKWEEGDSFFPLGMNGRKKISDYFIDEKFSRFQKEETFFLCSDQEIIWIIGHRMDDRFKITDKTKKSYIAELF